MKKTLAIILTVLAACPALHADGPKIKRGWSIAPLPAISYSTDLGLQLGVYCDIYDYGDGTLFPEYIHKINAEIAWFTKGSGIFHAFYDSKHLIPGIRLTASASYIINTMLDFYGFNGYSSPYSRSRSKGFNAIDRNLLRIMADFQGPIGRGFGWAAGASFWSYDISRIKLGKYADEVTLYDLYLEHGIIRPQEVRGGSHLELKAGAVYDTRDHEPDPMRGMYADIIFTGSPDIFSRHGNSYLKVALSFRHYVPLAGDRLTFAYRLSYQGTLAGRPPFYMQQNLTTLYLRQIYYEGLGGSVTLRGLLYTRVVGDGFAYGNAELRWRMFGFRLLRQDWYVVLNPFFDAGMVTQPYRLEAMKQSGEPLIYDGASEHLHMSAGAGLKFIGNRNFVISVELGFPFDRRDGTSGVNMGLNYIF